MLSRPALSIRRFISPKKQADVEMDDDPFYLNDEIDNIKAAYKESKTRSWKPPMMRRVGYKSSFDIPRSEDIHRISLIPPFPDTPNSSRSSLCSCENGTSQLSPRSSPGLPHPQSPRSSPPLHPQNVEQMHRGRGPSRSPPRIPGAPDSPPPTPQPGQHRRTPEPEADLSDIPLTFEMEDVPEQGGHAVDDSLVDRTTGEESGGLEDNIQQLIRETEEAFKLEGAFVEAEFPSPVLPEHQEASQGQEPVLSPLPLPLTPTRPTLPTRAKSQRLSQSSSIKSPTKPHMKGLLLPNPSRFAPVSKTKRTRSKKARRRPRVTSSQLSKWGLTESAREFTIRIFSRIEADEMLPESTLQEIRMSRASQSQWAKYKASAVKGVETDESETRIDSPGGSPRLPSVAEQVDTPRSSVSKNEEPTRDSCTTPTPEPQQQEVQQHPTHDAPAVVEKEFDDDEDTLPIMMIMDEQTSQTPTPSVPPPKRGSPRRLPSRQLPPLPTIPEVIATGPDNTVLSPTSIIPASGSATKTNKDDYVFFPSTRYTLTMPTFCHGPIRIAKADLPIGKLAAAVDESLDWTAFQMAILGGAGDFFSESTDYSRPSEAELDELDDIASWFASLGLGGSGGLVLEDDCPPTPTPPPQSADRPASVSSHKINRNARSSGKRRSSRITTHSQQRHSQENRAPETPIPVIVEPPTTTTPITPRQARTRDSISSSHHPSPREMGFQPLMAEAQPKRYLFAGAIANSKNGSGGGGGAAAAPRNLNHIGLAIDSTRRPSLDSVQSLPQSPMLDLVVSRDVGGSEYVVPMGFNLGHDLGDFLKWEAENVFAAGYGPDQA